MPVSEMPPSGEDARPPHPAAHPALHTAVIEAQYLPPIETFARLLPYRRVRFEAHEHWVKRSYRNRARVAGPHGEVLLSVPLRREGLHAGERRALHSVRIAHDEPWLREHWQTLEAGYRRSPYFEYYEDRLEPVFNTPHETLLERNVALFRFFAEALDLHWDLGLTDAWHREVSLGQVDLRDAVSPRRGRPDPFYRAPVYDQVFGERHGFLPGLSIADLLFNEGPRARETLYAALI